MKNIISAPPGAVKATISIPSSKSISNRMLIIRGLANSAGQLHNLSTSDDTSVLLRALGSTDHIKDVGHAGTSMRFLAAFLSTRPGEATLTGSDRMKQRPVGPLVNALKQLGADIEYLETEGCPPLRIRGGGISGGKIEIEAGISSQFISALMMIGPVLKGGLTITLTGDVVSSTYIEMTRSLMNRCGAGVRFDGRKITIPQGPYRVGDFRVESDWSGASYWYEVAALLPGSEIRLPHLSDRSLQGDSALVRIFDPLGVHTAFSEEGAVLRSRAGGLPEHFTYDFKGCPDLVQTMAVTLCALGIPFRFTGTSTLRVKETDRIHALLTELKRTGFILKADLSGEWMSWEGDRCDPRPDPVIRTYHDHRMAMAFAPLAVSMGQIKIEDPGVVTKSYPGYWEDLGKAGFGIIPA